MSLTSLYKILALVVYTLLVSGLSLVIVRSISNEDPINALIFDKHNEDSVNARHISELKATVDALSKEVSLLRSEYSSVKSDISIIKLANSSRMPKSIDAQESLNNNVENVVDNLSATESTLNDALLNQKNYLTKAFSSEPQDYKWSSKIETELSEIANSIGSNKVSNLATDCRSTMCKIEFVAETSNEFDAFIKQFSEKMPWAGPMQITSTLEDSGAIAAEVYVAKSGHQLPMP